MPFSELGAQFAAEGLRVLQVAIRLLVKHLLIHVIPSWRPLRMLKMLFLGGSGEAAANTGRLSVRVPVLGVISPSPQLRGRKVPLFAPNLDIGGCGFCCL